LKEGSQMFVTIEITTKRINGNEPLSAAAK